MRHVPVLLKESLEQLDPQNGDFVVDGTLGDGGHAREIIKIIMPKGFFLGTDLDEEILERTSEEIQRTFYEWKGRMAFVNENYRNLKNILKKYKFEKADKVFLDLGFSSMHIEERGKGFSFLKDEPLDMRYSKDNHVSATDVVNNFSEKDLADIIYKYGEERNSRRIAKAICEERRREKITNSLRLAQIIASVARFKGGRTHPATKSFQAIRIFVNGEFDNLGEFIKDLPEIIKKNGRVAIISYHSLEDRIVKNGFREFLKNGIAKAINKKPIAPSRYEIKNNPRSRSAKLRVIEFV